MLFLVEFDVGSFARFDERQGNERGLGVAGGGILFSLGNVLRVYHLVLNFTPDLQVAQALDRGAPIRREVWFRNRNPLELFGCDVVNLLRLQLASGWQPEHQTTARVDCTTAWREQSLAFELIDVFSVSGEEDVKRCAVFDLPGQICGGAETEDQTNPG